MSSTENRQACYPVPAFVLFFSKILIRIESYVTMAGRGGGRGASKSYGLISSFKSSCTIEKSRNENLKGNFSQSKIKLSEF